MPRTTLLTLTLLCIVHAAINTWCPQLAAEDVGLENLAAKAKISASSELKEQKLFAASVADGLIAPQGCGLLEVLPADKPAKSWAVVGKEAKGQGELVFEWKVPVEVNQIVYFGRTPWVLQECFKEYEVYLNDAKQPAAKGTFEMKHGPQRVRFAKTATRKLRIKFLSSYGGPNPGAAEVLVLGKEVSDAALAAMAPASPPVVRPWDQLTGQNIVWNSPSKDASGAMPLGNGSVLTNIWVDPQGDLLIALARSDPDKKTTIGLGRVRIKLDPPLSVEKQSLRQTLMFSNGAVEIIGQADKARPVFSIWVDANQPTLHVQLRCQQPVGVNAVVEHAGKAKPTTGGDRTTWHKGNAGCVMRAGGMKADAGGTLRSEKPNMSFDLQIQVVSTKTSAEIEKALTAIPKADVPAAIRGHVTAWREFWARGSIFIGGKDGDAITRALVRQRFLSASSGRGAYRLKPLPASAKPKRPRKKTATWTKDKIVAAIARATESANKYLAAEKSKYRFANHWGADFTRLPDAVTKTGSSDVDLRKLLAVADDKRITLLPGWPENRDVGFRLALPGNVRVEGLYAGRDFKSIEVWPKQRTGSVVGAAPYEKRVRWALPGYHAPALISFISPSWVAGRVGMDHFATSMKDANFNGYEGSIGDIGWCKKNKFYLIVHGANPWIAHTLKNEPNVASYFMADRNKPHAFGHFGNIRRQYEQIDPTHPTEFNTYAHWGGIEHFVDAVRPRLLEYYDYHWQRKAHLHFHFLEYYRRMSIAAGGIPVYRFVHVHGDNPVKMRQTVSMSIAYGLKGFKWWVGWTMFDIHKVKPNEPPPLSGIGKEARHINTTLSVFSPYLAPARSVEVFHTAPLPVSGRKAPDDYWVRPTGEQIVIGQFKNDKDDGDYLVVGNRDIGKPHKATLVFSTKIQAVRKIDKKTRKWVDLPLAPGKAPSVTVEVDRGDAELLQVVRRKT